MQLSPDKRRFQITNLKPMPNQIHALEPDPDELMKLKLIHQLENLEKQKFISNNLDYDIDQIKKSVSIKT